MYMGDINMRIVFVLILQQRIVYNCLGFFQFTDILDQKTDDIDINQITNGKTKIVQRAPKFQRKYSCNLIIHKYKRMAQ